MRSRALAAGRSALPSGFVSSGSLRSASPAALGFLRGRDADGRLRELGAARSAARPVLGALAVALCERRAYEALGFRSLGDYARERLGVGARSLREWARVWRALAELPRLRAAVVSGEVGWSVARLVVGLVTPETEVACLETVRGRTVRAVRAIVAAVREAEGAADPAEDDTDAAERVPVHLPCDRQTGLLWVAALELARRVAGEELPVWQCAERVAGEAASVLGGPELPDDLPAGKAPAAPGRASEPLRLPAEPGLRALAFPGLGWRARRGSLPRKITALAAGLEGCSPRELDRRLRAAIGFLQSVDLETGRILRPVQERRLFAELGFGSFGRYVEERLDVAPRTARRLVALARGAQRAPAVTTAFRRGEITAFQAQTLLRVADLASARRWVERAKRVTLRRLEDDVDGEPVPAIAFRAPPAVAELFLAMVARAGSLARLLAHAIATWVEQGKLFRDYADFSRDGFRCAVPGCTARKNLHSHHVWFRSRRGPDVAWNRITLCAFHHLRALHVEGAFAIRGRAPDRLVFDFAELGERFCSGDVLWWAARDSNPGPSG